MTSRELVKRTLEFSNSGRVPRQLWKLPWADLRYPGATDLLLTEFPDDIGWAPGFHRQALQTKGDPYAKGVYVDPWGCVFENLHEGIIGETKEAVVTDWSDLSRVRFPEELLTVDIAKVNEHCLRSDQFLIAGGCRPFEQLQFIRGTEAVYMDLALEEAEIHKLLAKMHAFYIKQLEVWAETEVDALFFLDDWGSQNSLLINPETWRRIFKPLYADYVRIAHASGKKAFMHSDGNILQVLPDLIEIGVDAINAQIFCMGLMNIAPYAGKITFWGEMDRQHLLVNGTIAQITQAVQDTKSLLSARGGGVIAQCEFGPGATPERIRAVFEAWQAIEPSVEVLASGQIATPGTSSFTGYDGSN